MNAAPHKPTAVVKIIWNQMMELVDRNDVVEQNNHESYGAAVVTPTDDHYHRKNTAPFSFPTYHISYAHSDGSRQEEEEYRCSRSIPIEKPIKRTPSEVQLYEEQALADYRDYRMYVRLIDGISKIQMKLCSDLNLRYENDETLANIIKTRHDPVPATPSPTATATTTASTVVHILSQDDPMMEQQPPTTPVPSPSYPNEWFEIGGEDSEDNPEDEQAMFVLDL